LIELSCATALNATSEHSAKLITAIILFLLDIGATSLNRLNYSRPRVRGADLLNQAKTDIWG
jgi:hypothetical protein